MITLTDLKKMKMQALKEKDTAKGNILGVLITAFQKEEIDKKAKNQEFSDGDALRILNKTLKELTDEREMYASAGKEDTVSEIDSQIALIKSFLPQLMSEEEIRGVIESLDDRSIKNIMVTFKTKYNGKADMSLVSKVAKSYQN